MSYKNFAIKSNLSAWSSLTFKKNHSANDHHIISGYHKRSKIKSIKELILVMFCLSSTSIIIYSISANLKFATLQQTLDQQ